MNQNSLPWYADCLNVVSILALSQGPNRLRKLARRHKAALSTAQPGLGETFWRLHEITHQRGDLAKQIGKDLDERFRSTLQRVRALDARAVREMETDWPLPFLWAVLRDEREEVRAHGRCLVHSIIWRALRDTFVKEGEGEDLRERVRSLEEQNRLQRVELEKMRLELESKTSDVESLKRRSRMGEPRFEYREGEILGQGRLEREIKKLRHELHAERQRSKEIKEKNGGAKNLRAPEGRDSPASDESAVVRGEASKICPYAESSDVSLLGETGALCAGCPLEGLRVAVIGGLERMMPLYRETLSKLGADLLFHDGKLRNGSFKLKSIVCGADIVVFITSVNSHSALNVVKAVCKKNGKRFIAMKETGSDSLSRALVGGRAN